MSRFSRFGSKLLDLWVPHLTASAITAMPNGCSPTYFCQGSSSCNPGATYHCELCYVNLACRVSCVCQSPTHSNCAGSGYNCTYP